mgnify:CR=1 FL=1
MVMGYPLPLKICCFEPFVTTKPKGEGRGLGLFIIQQLLDSSKCTIALEPFRNEHGRKYIFAINFSKYYQWIQVNKKVSSVEINCKCEAQAKNCYIEFSR